MSKKLLILLVLAVSLVLVGQQVFADELEQGFFCPRWSQDGQTRGGFGPGYGGMMGRGMSYGLATQVADALGADVNDVVTELQAGKSYLEIAEAKNVKAEDLKKAVLNSHMEMLLEAKANGNLTQEQVDWMQGRLESSLDARLSQKGFIGGNGRGGFGGGCGVRGPVQPQTVVSGNA